MNKDQGKRIDEEFYGNPYVKKGSNKLYNDLNRDLKKTYARHVKIAEETS